MAILKLYGFMVVCFMALSFYGCLILWFYGLMALWCYGFIVYGFMVYGFMVLHLWLYGCMVHCFMVLCFSKITKLEVHVFDRYVLNMLGYFLDLF